MIARHTLFATSILAAVGLWAGGCQPARPAARPVVRVKPTPVTQPAATPPTMSTASEAPDAPAAASAVQPAPASDNLITGRQPVTGRPCRLHLRRDAMGLMAMAPLPLNAGSPGARALQFDGVLEDASDRWVVLRAEGGRVYWFPSDVILTIEFTDAR